MNTYLINKTVQRLVKQAATGINKELAVQEPSDVKKPSLKQEKPRSGMRNVALGAALGSAIYPALFAIIENNYSDVKKLKSKRDWSDAATRAKRRPNEHLSEIGFGAVLGAAAGLPFIDRPGVSNTALSYSILTSLGLNVPMSLMYRNDAERKSNMFDSIMAPINTQLNNQPVMRWPPGVKPVPFDQLPKTTYQPVDKWTWDD